MKFENQNWYANVPYPSAELPKATIKSGGCGCVSSCNVAIFFGNVVTVPELAKAFVNNKIRVNGGTDMAKAAQYLCDTYKLHCTTTCDEKVLLDGIKSGCIAIANVDGDEGAKGIFSTQGHFINIVGYDGIPPKPFIAFDVGYYDGKFSDSYRKQYVSVSKDRFGNVIQFTTQQALDIDTKNKNPQYWLFTN